MPGIRRFPNATKSRGLTATLAASIVLSGLSGGGCAYSGMAATPDGTVVLARNSLLGANADPTYRDQLNECFLRMTVRTRDKRVADGFGRLFPWLGLSGPPYVGSMKGIQPAKELLGIWPTLVSREFVEKKVKIEMEKT